MTERDELVERTARAIASELTALVHATQPDDIPVSYIEAVSENYHGAARAAIAECEKAWNVTYTIQAPKELSEAQTKIAELEAKLAEETRQHFQVANFAYDLQAQCAAIRAALEWVGELEHLKTGKLVKDMSRVKEALSPDAGRKVLDVVRAAHELNAWRIVVNTESARGRWHYRIEMGPSERHLDDALSALGWKS